METKKTTGHGWYALLSDEDKAKYLEKRRIARQQKKSSNMTTLEHDQEACTLDGPSHNVQCAAISNISNTQIDGKMLNPFFLQFIFMYLPRFHQVLHVQLVPQRSLIIINMESIWMGGINGLAKI
jgi:hypothetical protein